MSVIVCDLENSKLRGRGSALGQCAAENDCNDMLPFEIYIASLAGNISRYVYFIQK